MRHEDELQQRIDAARSRMAASKQSGSMATKRSKSQKVAREADPDSDSDFLVHEGEPGRDGAADDSAYLSPAVKALMEQLNPASGTSNGIKPFYAKRDAHDGQDDEPETSPKIIYASRTHTQLTQFIAELKKTSFGKQVETVLMDKDEKQPSRSVSLGSRKQMCINGSVQEVGKRVGMEAMNERCVEIMKTSASKKSKCDFLPPSDENGQAKILEYRDHAFGQVRDIEDLVELGEKMHICPYFGARASARQAQLVTLPYNLLLQANARASLNMSLKGSIVIIDEAHNLIDTILSVHTVTITSRQVKQAQIQIDHYLQRFSAKLKGSNEVNLKKLLKLLDNLGQECGRQQQALEASKRSEEIVTGSSLVSQMGGNLDQVNLLELERWLKDTQIARKVAGYAEKQATRADDAPSQVGRSSAVSALHSIQAFLLSLANQSDDGRVLMSLSPATAGEERLMTLKYQLLNPADVFRDIVSEARSVILAGGTMEPIADFSTQLLPDLDSARLVHFACSHVIPAANLMAAVVGTGPRGSQLEFKYDARNDTSLLDDLSNCIANYCSVIPHGLVVFLPSYAFLDALTARWQASKALDRIASKKAVFYEPKLATDVDSVLREYSSAASNAGAILFAVVGAKLSEGINFSDRLARAVIMVGMPFANSASPELAERMKYVRGLSQASPAVKKDAGQELYVNLCMKAVNQSIGRAIRHQSDYAALILLDQRYGRKDIRDRLPACES